MTSIYTYRLLVVVTAAMRDAAEAAGHDIDPGAEVIFRMPLRAVGDATNTIVAYRCSWLMVPDDGPRLLQALRAHGFSNKEIGEVLPGSTPDMSDNLWVFDEGKGWTPQSANAALGFAELAPTMPPPPMPT